ncbi:MAG TPA: DUF4912 domain-containing protein [Pyrinomonadaceae bacterium]|nr:DUF4912 domain-containing protein [Pyrinomonadaceae bacterium]
MSEDVTKKELLETEETEPITDEIALEEFELNPLSSAEFIKAETDEVKPEVKAPQFLVAEEPVPAEAEADSEAEVDPIFAELATPKLPELARENRARLQMQSPNRLYFYWSIKNNPFQILQKVFAGNTGSYQLVAKFVNLKTEREEIRAVEAEGNYWFNADSDAKYRAEIGFYAPNRPYIRVIFSNTIETPRKSPSPRTATDADWAVSASTFAQVLDISGFKQDAFEVALAGDDFDAAENATQSALNQLIGKSGKPDFSLINSDEVRFALLALASGATLEELRGQISEALFIILQEHVASLSAENALSALKEHFDVFDEEIFEEEQIGAAVFGASLVNFPKTIRKRTVPKTGLPKDTPDNAPKYLPKLSPLSSFSLRN